MIEPHENEGGFAVVYALLIVLIVGGVVGVVFSTSLAEQTQAGFELDYEDTLHVAEAGAEIFLQRLAEDPEDDSGVQGPTAAGLEPSAWAIGLATDRSLTGTYTLDATEPLIDMGEGEVVAIRPADADANFIYGVGFTPNRDAYVAGLDNAYARVVRVQIAFSPQQFPGESAILAGGNLTMNGSFKITGDNGSVHTNGGLKVNGSVGQAEDGITYSGTCANDPCDGTLNAPISGPVATEPIPEVDPRNVWGTDDALEIAAQGLWYDYCSGLWYQRDPNDDEPCTGVAMSMAPVPWSGTNFEGTDGSSTVEGVFFFRDEVDLDIKRPNGSITIITAGNISVGPSANAPTLDGLYPGLLFLAGGDIELESNFNAAELDEPALVFANGSLDFHGNPDTDNIAFIARDSLNLGTDYSGTGTVNYDGGAIPDLGEKGEPIVVQWDEVR